MGRDPLGTALTMHLCVTSSVRVLGRENQINAFKRVTHSLVAT
jgi:hypothetical protein